MKACFTWGARHSLLGTSRGDSAEGLASRTRKRSSTGLNVVAWGKKSAQQQISQSVPAKKAPLPLASQPLYVKAGAALLIAVAAFQMLKKFRSRGSMGNLESRGLLTEGEQTINSSDPFYNKMMRNVNTVQYEELSQDQIEAARKRRSQDRRNNEKIDLDKIQLPANHPFAVSKELSEEEEQLQMARLNVRRGMPLRDLNELKSRPQAPAKPFDRDPSFRRDGAPNREGRFQ